MFWRTTRLWADAHGIVPSHLECAGLLRRSLSNAKYARQVSPSIANLWNALTLSTTLFPLPNTRIQDAILLREITILCRHQDIYSLPFFSLGIFHLLFSLLLLPLLGFFVFALWGWWGGAFFGGGLIIWWGNSPLLFGFCWGKRSTARVNFLLLENGNAS